MNSKEIARIAVTVTMWLILGFISFVAIAGEGVFNTTIQGDVTAMALGPLILAMIGTAIIWTTDNEKSEGETGKATAEALEKAKREGSALSMDKLALLMELMDDEELRQFKETLKREVLSDMGYASDGESSYDYQTLESLFDEEGEDKRLRR
jgi:hypothetical protein